MQRDAWYNDPPPDDEEDQQPAPPSQGPSPFVRELIRQAQGARDDWNQPGGLDTGGVSGTPSGGLTPGSRDDWNQPGAVPEGSPDQGPPPDTSGGLQPGGRDDWNQPSQEPPRDWGSTNEPPPDAYAPPVRDDWNQPSDTGGTGAPAPGGRDDWFREEPRDWGSTNVEPEAPGAETAGGSPWDQGADTGGGTPDWTDTNWTEPGSDWGSTNLADWGAQTTGDTVEPPARDDWARTNAGTPADQEPQTLSDWIERGETPPPDWGAQGPEGGRPGSEFEQLPFATVLALTDPSVDPATRAAAQAELAARTGPEATPTPVPWTSPAPTPTPTEIPPLPGADVLARLGLVSSAEAAAATPTPQLQGLWEKFVAEQTKVARQTATASATEAAQAAKAAKEVLGTQTAGTATATALVPTQTAQARAEQTKEAAPGATAAAEASKEAKQALGTQTAGTATATALVPTLTAVAEKTAEAKQTAAAAPLETQTAADRTATASATAHAEKIAEDRHNEARADISKANELIAQGNAETIKWRNTGSIDNPPQGEDPGASSRDQGLQMLAQAQQTLGTPTITPVPTRTPTPVPQVVLPTQTPTSMQRIPILGGLFAPGATPTGAPDRNAPGSGAPPALLTQTAGLTSGGLSPTPTPSPLPPGFGVINGTVVPLPSVSPAPSFDAGDLSPTPTPTLPELPPIALDPDQLPEAYGSPTPTESPTPGPTRTPMPIPSPMAPDATATPDLGPLQVPETTPPPEPALERTPEPGTPVPEPSLPAEPGGALPPVTPGLLPGARDQWAAPGALGPAEGEPRPVPEGPLAGPMPIPGVPFESSLDLAGLDSGPPQLPSPAGVLPPGAAIGIPMPGVLPEPGTPGARAPGLAAPVPPGPGTPADPAQVLPAIRQVARTLAERPQAVNQFEQGLPLGQAASICGPVAALAFAQDAGRTPTLQEAMTLARSVGWTESGGMNGVANEARLLAAMGVPARLDTSPQFADVARDVAGGNPVIISTPIHYYYANQYNPATGQLFVGETGQARRGGGTWMSAQEIARLDGGINGVLYVDNPGAASPSVAAAPRQPGMAVTEPGPGPGALPTGPVTQTTVQLSPGASAGRSVDQAAGVARVYRDALANGLDEEGARAAAAVALTEGGMGGAVGDRDRGLGSGGAFQLFFGPPERQGQGNIYARAQGMTNEQALAALALDPHSANAWALGPTGYLAQAIRQGQARGLKGAALAEYAQRNGQISESPERAARNYAAASAMVDAARGVAAAAGEAATMPGAAPPPATPGTLPPMTAAEAQAALVAGRAGLDRGMAALPGGTAAAAPGPGGLRPAGTPPPVTPGTLPGAGAPGTGALAATGPLSDPAFVRWLRETGHENLLNAPAAPAAAAAPGPHKGDIPTNKPGGTAEPNAGKMAISPSGFYRLSDGNVKSIAEMRAELAAAGWTGNAASDPDVLAGYQRTTGKTLTPSTTGPVPPSTPEQRAAVARWTPNITQAISGTGVPADVILAAIHTISLGDPAHAGGLMGVPASQFRPGERPTNVDSAIRAGTRLLAGFYAQSRDWGQAFRLYLGMMGVQPQQMAEILAMFNQERNNYLGNTTPAGVAGPGVPYAAGTLVPV